MIDHILSKLHDVKQSGSGKWLAYCPAHEDRKTRSLCVTQGDGKILLHCFAGCDVTNILDKLGMTQAVLFDKEEEKVKPVIIATYDYVDEAGTVLYQVVRYQPKGFHQRRPKGNGWEWGLGDVRRVLYRLPKLIQAIQAGRWVFLCEGEKDVHTLESMGRTATTNCGGAKGWRDDYSTTPRGDTHEQIQATARGRRNKNNQ